MNKFKAKSACGVRSGYWADFYTNREIKRTARRQARHLLNKELRKEN